MLVVVNVTSMIVIVRVFVRLRFALLWIGGFSGWNFSGGFGAQRFLPFDQFFGW